MIRTIEYVFLFDSNVILWACSGCGCRSFEGLGIVLVLDVSFYGNIRWDTLRPMRRPVFPVLAPY